jgi:hypothetical protein
MSLDITAAEALASNLNERLKPIANRLVDINDPNWAKKFRSALDEAGVRQDAEDLLRSLLDAYATEDASRRDAIRRLFSRNSAFAWATGVPEPATSHYGFRQRLLRISALDQTQDIRDAVLMLNELCGNAKSAGIDVAPLLDEAAALSSDTGDRHFGSLKDIFLRVRGRWA